MRLKLLAISDTHLGEETSVLTFPQGRWHLWQQLRRFFGGGEGPEERFQVNELILLGDIPDRTLSSTSQIITHTNAFTCMLGSVAEIRKGVYVPGNHDHTLWTNYRRVRYGENHLYGITAREGEEIIKNGNPCAPNLLNTEIMSTFFGYPCGSPWREWVKPGNRPPAFDFSVANPLYVTHTNSRIYAFTHGAHFAPAVTCPKWAKRLGDYLQLDLLFGGIEIESDCDVNQARDLRSLELITAPFMDSLWPSSKNCPTSTSDELWYVLCRLSHRFRNRRPHPQDTQRFSWEMLQGVSDKRIKRLTPANAQVHPSIQRWQRHFRDHMLRCLEDYRDDNNIDHKNLTFVYGDTHAGGWGEIRNCSGWDIRLYNCGGWVVDKFKDHPACHLFAVDTDGEEYLLDVSFKDRCVDEEFLLALASADVENRGHEMQFFLAPLFNLSKLLRRRARSRMKCHNPVCHPNRS